MTRPHKPSSTSSTTHCQEITMGSETPPSEIPEDPFADLSKLVMSQDFERQAGVEKLITVVPIRKPKRHEFIRVHPDSEFRMSPAGIIDLKEEREQYLVLPPPGGRAVGRIQVHDAAPRGHQAGDFVHLAGAATGQ